MTHRRKTGQEGEQFIAKQLIERGFTILAQNYRKQYGEIDLIARKKELLIFVEVKTRRGTSPDLTFLVPPSKQRKIGLVAREYLSSHDIDNMICRFDVALLDSHDNAFQVQYIENAFCYEE